MSSPNINNIMVVGCIMCYACVFLFGADFLLESHQEDTHSVLCKVKWPGSLGLRSHGTKLKHFQMDRRSKIGSESPGRLDNQPLFGKESKTGLEKMAEIEPKGLAVYRKLISRYATLQIKLRNHSGSRLNQVFECSPITLSLDTNFVRKGIYEIQNIDYGRLILTAKMAKNKMTN